MRATVGLAVLLGACGFGIGAVDERVTDAAPADAAAIDAPPDAPGPPIANLQVAAHFEDNVAMVSCTYGKPQTAGNVNLVVVSWSSGTNDVASVTDTAGNTYTKVPLLISGAYSLRLFYAQNIVASASNRVTASFAQAMPFPKLRISEYAGLATANLYERGVTSAGTGTTQMAGPVTTTTPHALLFAPDVYNGSSMPVAPFAGVDFSDGDLIEAYEVTTPGTYTATASGSASTNWVMMLAVLRGR